MLTGLRKIAFSSLTFLILSFTLNVCFVEGEIIVVDLKQLTSGPEIERGTDWSPDGSKIVFDSEIGDNSDIWVMNSDGSNVIQLINSTYLEYMPCWNYDGSKIVYWVYPSRFEDSDIWVMYSNGSNQKAVANTSRHENYPRWSPDGSKIVFDTYSDYNGGNRDIWVMNADGSNWTRLTTHSSSDWDPDYSPDGSKILFHSERSGNYDIWIMDSDGSNKKQLTFTPWLESISTWSPDGTKIAYKSNKAGNWDIWVMDSDGGNQTQLTNHTAADHEPSWSSDVTKIAFTSERSGNRDIWVMTILDTESPPEPPPIPTSNSLIISSDNWRNIISAIPARVPVIVANQLTNDVEGFINDYSPDYIYTLGFSLDMNNSYQIDYEQVPGLFFPNATRAVYIENQTQGIFASNLAYYMDLPIIFEKDLKYEIIDLSDKSIREIQNLYLNELRGNEDQIDYLVLTNLESQTSLFASRISGLRRGYVVPINISNIQYLENITVTNDNNKVNEIRETLNETVGFLAEEGFYSSSPAYKRENPLYLAILGDEYDIPFIVSWDSGMEWSNDKDGDRIYNDLWYGDVNDDLFLDLAMGRFYGDLTSISLQLERTRIEKDNNATLVGLYRHRKYEDVYHFEGGMAQAWNAQRLLDLAGMETRRIVEKRIGFSDDFDEFMKQIAEIGIKELIMHILKALSEVSESILANSLGAITIVWPLADATSMINYAFYEYNWAEWIQNMNQGNVKIPEHLEVFGVDTDLGNPKILGYFGLGDEYWIVPPDDRSELELISDPYGRSENLTALNFSNFLYDDHDISINSSITKQVLSRGGMVFGSSGVIHDVYTIYTSNDFFRNLVRGESVGESLRQTTNINVLDDFKAAFYLILKGTLPLPNLYVKDKLERVLLADPKYTPIEDGAEVEEPGWIIEPYHSYLSSIKIKPDYYVKNRTVYVTNADSPLIEQGEPIIPIFVREFVLPKGSEINKVKLNLYYRTYKKVKIPIVPWDEYYQGMPATFDGNYPNKTYWYKTNELLDGRILVTVYVPGIVYRGFKTKVLRLGKIKIDYESPVEILIKTENIRLYREGKIKVEVMNRGEEAVNGTLWVWIGKDGFNKEFKRDVFIESESDRKELFTFKPNETGKYKATAIFDSEIPVGPRYQYFEVWKYKKYKHHRWWYWFIKFLQKYKKCLDLFG